MIFWFVFSYLCNFIRFGSHLLIYTEDFCFKMPSREGCRVFLGNLPSDIRERDIERFFDRYGRVRNIFVKNGKYGFCVSPWTHLHDCCCITKIDCLVFFKYILCHADRLAVYTLAIYPPMFILKMLNTFFADTPDDMTYSWKMGLPSL